MCATRIDFEKFVKERAVIDYCLTHFFRAGFIALPPQCECASRAVILNDHRMIHREIVGTPIEIFDGVATRGHHLRDELIGLAYGPVRVVDKECLDAAPFPGERIGLFLSELVQVETVHTISALPENGFSACRADGLNGSFILGAESFAQVHPSTPARVRPDSKPKQQNNDDRTNEHEGF
jgi:hypothetical protein